MVDEKLVKEFAELVEPLQKFINKNFDSFTKIIIESDKAEVVKVELGTHKNNYEDIKLK